MEVCQWAERQQTSFIPKAHAKPKHSIEGGFLNQKSYGNIKIDLSLTVMVEYRERRDMGRVSAGQ